MAAAEVDEEEVAITVADVLVPKPPHPNHTHNERTNLIFVPLESIHSEVPNVPRSAEEDLTTNVYRQAERRLEEDPL